VPSAIVKAGLQPALCDIDPSTFDYNHALLKETINDDVLCVVSTHLFGIPADVEKIKSLCRPRGIFIVEDAAQAMGGQIDGKMLGTIGDVGLFSLGRGKNITCGSGGIIVTNSDAIAAAITAQYNDLDNPHVVENLKDYISALLTALFVHPVLYWFPAGLPFLKLGQTTYCEDFPVKKLSGMKAGLLQNWKDLLEQCNNSRKMTAAMFQELCKVDQRGKGSIPYLRLPILCDNQDEKDKMYSSSQEAGLGMSLMYPTPINEIKELRGRFEGRTFPFAKLVSKRLLTIPTHPLMKIEDRERLKNILFKMGQYC
jgi:dTDP-4-amino-4,6-dideoxygalactose transaminase